MDTENAHPGIELRLMTQAEVIFQGNSDVIYYGVSFAGGSSCLPDCSPRCQDHGWFEILRVPGVSVEVRPVMLPDELPEDV